MDLQVYVRPNACPTSSVVEKNVKKKKEVATSLSSRFLSSCPRPQASTVLCAQSSWRRMKSRSTCSCVSAKHASPTTVRSERGQVEGFAMRRPQLPCYSLMLQCHLVIIVQYTRAKYRVQLQWKQVQVHEGYARMQHVLVDIGPLPLCSLPSSRWYAMLLLQLGHEGDRQ